MLILSRRTIYFTCGTTEGAALNSSTPNPINRGVRKGVAGNFTAHAGPDAVPVRGVHGGFDQPQDGRMRGFVQLGNPFVGAVGGQGVLDQIVAADAEKFRPLGQGVGDQGGGRDFDHRADGHVFVKGFALGAQFVLAFFDDGVGLVQFVQAGNHGIHHLHVALGAGAENGAELGAEQFRLGEAEPDRPPAEKRIHFLRQLQVRGKFVFSDQNQHRISRHHKSVLDTSNRIR